MDGHHAGHVKADKHAVHLALVQRLRAQAAEVQRLAAGLDEETLATHGVPGKWSMKELICHCRRMPLNREGTLTADEVYALTAFLLSINGVIPEDQVIDAQSLPKVKMPIGDKYAALPEWKPRTPRLKGYPY